MFVISLMSQTKPCGDPISPGLAQKNCRPDDRITANFLDSHWSQGLESNELESDKGDYL